MSTIGRILVGAVFFTFIVSANALAQSGDVGGKDTRRSEGQNESGGFNWEGREKKTTLNTVTAIAGVSTKARTGVLLSDHRGTIHFQEEGLGKSAKKIPSSPALRRLFPLSMVFSDPVLYVFDGNTKDIWMLEPFGSGKPKVEPFNIKLTQPQNLAVSPQGIVAVVDEGKLILLQKGKPTSTYSRSDFRHTSGLAFSAWDTLHVLDSAQNALVTITFNRLSDGEIRYLTESISSVKPPMTKRWEALDVIDGIVHLASNHDVFAHIDNRLVPIVPRRVEYDGIKDIAVTRNTIYLKVYSTLVTVPRAIPVEFFFSGDARSSQDALIEFYGYLDKLDLLPKRVIRSRRSGDVASHNLLFEEGVLLSPIPITDQQASVISPGLTASLVKQDQSLKIPDIPIERSLSRDSIELTQPVGAHLLDLVPSAELRRLIDASFLRRLNPWFDEFSDDKILAADEGIAVMPMEQWALTTAVPVTDLDLSTSPLWVIQRKYPGVSIVTREAFVEFSGAAAGPPALPAEPTDCNEFKDETQHQVECECALLQKARDSWLAQVRFPSATSIGAQRYRQLTETPVRVGVLEQRTTLIHDHRVFTASDHPAWYGFDILGDLVPNPVGQSAANRGMERLNPRSFSTSSHHGSHVAALLGGRQSECWSGLLPSARLVLVDLSDFAKVSRALDRSVKAFVQVFNVSQRFVEDENATKTDPNASYYRWLTKEIEQHKSALWVVAAGNDGRDLNGLKGGDVPLPAGWNPRHNVLVVTASDANGDIPESEVNHGKRYVDLVGVGKDVVSATEQNQYGPASGTSQATPQVAAAAATLVDRLGPRLSPGDVKARLIATAEWKPHYEGNVWGGRLDFDAAASFPDRDILVTTTSRASRKRYAVVVNDDARVEILNAPHYYERVGAAGATAPESILFSRILSLRKLSEGGFRVVLREPEQNHLKILLNAQLADADGDQRIRCASFEVFDPEADAFIPDEGCDHGLSVETIDSYFQGGAYQINWESIDE